MFYYFIPHSIYFEQACQIIHQKILMYFRCWLEKPFKRNLTNIQETGSCWKFEVKRNFNFKFQKALILGLRQRDKKEKKREF